MKKYSLFVGFLSALILPSFASAGYIVRDIEVKDSVGSAYDQSVTLASSGKTFDIRLSLVSDNSTSPLLTTPHRVSLTLPSWLAYVSRTIESSTCSGGNALYNESASNTSYVFDFLPNASTCETVVSLKYRTNGISVGSYANISPVIRDAWVDQIFGTSDDTSTVSTFNNTISLIVSTKNPLISAITVDSDNDGYIDAYDVTFWNTISAAFPYSSTTLSYLTTSFAPSSFNYAAWSYTGRLAFSNTTLGTAAVPTISIPSNSNYIDGDFYVWVCQDGAAPNVITTVAPGTYTGAISVWLSAAETGTIRYSTGSSVSGTSSLYSSAISINSNTTLLTLATDAFGNSTTKSFAYTFACGNTAPSNATLSAYPSCSVVCNSGYTLSGGSCVKSSSSSGGGGGGWLVVVTPPKTSTGTTSTGSTATGATNSGTTVGGNTGSDAAWLSGYGYSTGSTSQNKYVYSVGKIAKDNLYVYRTKSEVLSGVLAKWENKYIFKINAVYTSKSINAARYKETIYAYNRFILFVSMWKMDKPLDTYKNAAISAYNIFYKVYKRPILPTKTTSSTSSSTTSTVTTTTTTTTTPVVSESIMTKKAQILAGNGLSFVFTKDLSVWSKWSDILRLQKILMEFGYLKITTATDYYGNLTSEALKLFQKEVLEIQSPSGKLDTTTRTKMKQLSWE